MTQPQWTKYKMLKHGGTIVNCNFKTTSSAYLSPDCKFYSISRFQIKDSLEALINSGKYSQYKIKKISTKSEICESSAERNPEELFFLLEMQTRFGVPELIGFKKDQASFKYYTKKYSTTPPCGLSLKDMTRQLLLALKTLHDEGIVHGKLNVDDVQWSESEIKLVAGYYYGRVDMDRWMRERYQPARDMHSAGRIIHQWNTNREKDPPIDSDLHALSLVLLNEEPGLRISASEALDLLEKGSLEVVSDLTLDKFNFPYFLKMFSDEALHYMVIEQIEQLLLKTPIATKQVRQVTKHYGNITWHTHTTKSDVVSWLHGDCTEGKPFFGKLYTCRYQSYKSLAFPLEPLILQTLNESSLHFQKIVSQELFRSKEDSIMFIIVMPEYATEPKEKNIIRFANQLLDALNALHSMGLIHGQIDPTSIGWDENDSLIVQHIHKFVFVNTRCENQVSCYNEFGNKKDRAKKIESDIYSAGKVIEYFAKKWRQESEQINQIVAKMTCDNWYERIPLAIAKTSFESLAAVPKVASPSKRRRM